MEVHLMFVVKILDGTVPDRAIRNPSGVAFELGFEVDGALKGGVPG